MRANIGKGTDICTFFGDYYRFLSEHYIPESDEKYWELLINSANEISRNYSECDFILFVKGLLLVTTEWLDKSKYMKKEGLRWHISLMTNEEYERFDSALRKAREE